MGTRPASALYGRRLDEVFARTKQRLFFSCFSSSIHRLRIATDLAMEHGRKIAIVGPVDAEFF